MAERKECQLLVILGQTDTAKQKWSKKSKGNENMSTEMSIDAVRLPSDPSYQTSRTRQLCPVTVLVKSHALISLTGRIRSPESGVRLWPFHHCQRPQNIEQTINIVNNLFGLAREIESHCKYLPTLWASPKRKSFPPRSHRPGPSWAELGRAGPARLSGWSWQLCKPFGAINYHHQQMAMWFILPALFPYPYPT